MADPDYPPERSMTGGVFATTHWSVVLQAGDAASSQNLGALEKLCRTYWFPLYAFLRRKGHAEADAKDLTQAFFELLLERKDFQTVNRSKGRFRTFLLAALTHFLANERDRAQAAKRGGGRTIISLDTITTEQWQQLEPASTLSPDKLFDQRWAMTLLEVAATRLREEAVAAGRALQFEQLKTFLTNEPTAGEYAAAAERLGCNSQVVAVAVHRLRQRYRELVRTEVAHTVSSPLEVAEEMRHLYAALNT
jgi:DNA-directed RNA polymerase specialized sigma24 family protein